MSIVQRSVRSSAYNIVASMIQTVVLALRSIILARLLTPEDYGGYAFISSIIIFASSIPNFGMSAAYIHRAKESEGEEALRVYFTLSVLFNLVWAAIFAALAQLIVEPGYRWVFWIILATQVIDNLGRVGQVKLIKNVVFLRMAFINVAVVIGTTVSAILLAWNGFHIWSLVSTNIIASLIMLIGYYTYRPIWRPRFGWSSKISKYFVDFGKRTFVAGLLGQALDRVDDLWTGIFLGDTALGFYSRAYTFATYPRKILATPLGNVAGSTYAELKDRPKELSQAFYRVNAFLIRSGFLLGGMMALIAPEFIHLLIGEKWLPMLTAFRLMLVYTLLDPIKGTVANLFISIGYPQKVMQTRAFQLLILLGALFLLGPTWGIEGVALAVDIMLVFGIILLLWQARDHVSVSIKKLFMIPFIALLVSLGFSYFILQFSVNIENYWISGIIKVISFSLSYVLILIIFERDQIIILINSLRHVWFKDEAKLPNG